MIKERGSVNFLFCKVKSVHIYELFEDVKETTLYKKRQFVQRQI